MTFGEPSTRPAGSQRAAPLTMVAKVAVVLEVLLAVGALAGGAIAIASPDGSAFGIPLSLLEHSGFTSFLYPGLLLFVVNGLFPLVSAIATLRGRSWAARSVMAVGVLLAGWIAVQVMLLRSFYAPLHGAYFLLGVVIAALGLAMHRSGRRPAEANRSEPDPRRARTRTHGGAA